MGITRSRLRGGGLSGAATAKANTLVATRAITPAEKAAELKQVASQAAPTIASRVPVTGATSITGTTLTSGSNAVTGATAPVPPAQAAAYLAWARSRFPNTPAALPAGATLVVPKERLLAFQQVLAAQAAQPAKAVTTVKPPTPVATLAKQIASIKPSQPVKLAPQPVKPPVKPPVPPAPPPLPGLPDWMRPGDQLKPPGTVPYTPPQPSTPPQAYPIMSMPPGESLLRGRPVPDDAGAGANVVTDPPTADVVPVEVDTVIETGTAPEPVLDQPVAPAGGFPWLLAAAGALGVFLLSGKK